MKDEGKSLILQKNNDQTIGTVSLLPSIQENESVIDVLPNVFSLRIPPIHKSRWENTVLYLETELEDNESLYYHFGFKIIDMMLPSDNCTGIEQTMWLTVHAPK